MLKTSLKLQKQESDARTRETNNLLETLASQNEQPAGEDPFALLRRTI